MELAIRGMISHDVPEIMEIDRLASPQPLPEAAVRRWLRFTRPRPRIGLVAECREADEREHHLVGFAFYTVARGRMILNRLAVHPTQWRQGVGRRLLADVQRRTLTHCVPRVVATVSESDLAVLRFARACGVRAVGLARGHYGDADGVKLEMPGGFSTTPPPPPKRDLTI